MSDLEMLGALWAQYREELTKRAQGVKYGAGAEGGVRNGV